MLEAEVQAAIRIAASEHGARLWRNNSGAAQEPNGRVVRYGLGNESAAVNATMKSGDLIGIIPHIVIPGDVGRVLGIFASIECKTPGWHLTPGDKRGQAQLLWIEFIRSMGGYATFATSPADLWPEKI